ncbi:helix-turn-helix domain-containing protein [Streptantibioticus parmotrematis]|uniref:helix-turn-helix domain-containing protein n=1 Tax=Streptantibioticus parmotrematis TaxID=2873249 RepID=UPI0035560E94
MPHDAFAREGLGSSALVIVAALNIQPAQTVGELIATSSVSRATAYRSLRTLVSYGLVLHDGEVWHLAPRAIEGLGGEKPGREALGSCSRGWDVVAEGCGSAGVSARRHALHAKERAAYLRVLEHLAERRTPAAVVERDGHLVLVPRPAPDEVPPNWRGPAGTVLDPSTGRIDTQWRVATDGRLILITPADQRTYDELAAAHAVALTEWETAS